MRAAYFFLTVKLFAVTLEVVAFVQPIGLLLISSLFFLCRVYKEAEEVLKNLAILV